MNEAKYTINHTIDGWPVCKDGEAIPNNKAMLAELHQLQARVKELEAINLGLTKTLLEEESEKARLVEALESLVRGYVNLLEAGAGRITSLGGDCDPVSIMERNDPWLRDARTALSAHRKGAQP